MTATASLKAQLEAVGPQDVYLDLNPDRSFFHNETIQHTPFAMYETVNTVQGASAAAPGTALTAQVSAEGDVLSGLTLYFLGDPGSGSAEAPFDRVQVSLNGQNVHDVDEVAYRLNDRILPRPARASQLVSGRPRTASGTQVYVPLRWKVLLPVIALNMDLSVKITLSSSWSSFDDVKLLCNYVLVAAPERNAFQNNDIDIVYDQFECLHASNSVVGIDMDVLYKSRVDVDLSSLQSPTKAILFAVEEAGNPKFVDVVDTASVVIGGVSVTDVTLGSKFSLLNVYQCADAGLGDEVVYCHYNALNPASPSPSGACNLGVYQKKVLSIVFNREGAFTVRVCAISINFLKIKSRQARVMFG